MELLELLPLREPIVWLAVAAEDLAAAVDSVDLPTLGNRATSQVQIAIQTNWALSQMLLENTLHSGEDLMEL